MNEIEHGLTLAWLAGFAASAEGLNGEYPNELPESPLEDEVDPKLLIRAENYVNSIPRLPRS